MREISVRQKKEKQIQRQVWEGDADVPTGF